jgi:hypothetical protein
MMCNVMIVLDIQSLSYQLQIGILGIVWNIVDVRLSLGSWAVLCCLSVIGVFVQAIMILYVARGYSFVRLGEIRSTIY